MIESDKIIESKNLNITRDDCNHYVFNAIQVIKSLIHLHIYYYGETDNKSLIGRVDKRIYTLLRLYDFICEEGRTILDNGIGITSEKINHSNTLGLFLSKKIVEDQLNGEFNICSNSGTKVLICMPC